MTQPSLRIGFGVTALGKGSARHELDGIGYYTQELGATLVSRGHHITPYQFGNTPFDQFLGQPVHRWPRYQQTVVLSALTGMAMPGSDQLNGQVDLFHSTDHFIPRIKSVPHVATLMDVIPLSNPEWMLHRLRKTKNAIWKQSTHWPDHIITISEYSKSQLVEYLGLRSDDISVSYLGVDRRYYDRFNRETIGACLTKHGLGEQFFLFVGTLQPRKNLEKLVSAHLALPPEVRQAFPLVIVGREGWGNINWTTLLGRDHIHWLQHVSDIEKRALMQTGTAMVFPSLAEGFGLPVIEAFASELPVIASNTTAIPEVAGNAALLVDPEDVGMLSEAMLALALDESHRQDMKQKGLARAQTFTWETCAEATLKAYQKVL